jgi:hypothetical protein
MHTLKITFDDNTHKIVELEAPNQRDAKKIAKEEACAEKFVGEISEESLSHVISVDYI